MDLTRFVGSRLISRGGNLGHGARGEEAAVAASQYEIRISGRLGEMTLLAFEGLTVRVNPAETVLTGPLLDQAALHGVLEQVESLGLELVEVRRLTPPAGRRATASEDHHPTDSSTSSDAPSPWPSPPSGEGGG